MLDGWGQPGLEFRRIPLNAYFFAAVFLFAQMAFMRSLTAFLAAALMGFFAADAFLAGFATLALRCFQKAFITCTTWE